MSLKSFLESLKSEQNSKSQSENSPESPSAEKSNHAKFCESLKVKTDPQKAIENASKKSNNVESGEGEDATAINDGPSRESTVSVRTSAKDGNNKAAKKAANENSFDKVSQQSSLPQANFNFVHDSSSKAGESSQGRGESESGHSDGSHSQGSHSQSGHSQGGHSYGGHSQGGHSQGGHSYGGLSRG